MHFSSSISLAIFMAFFGPFLFLFLATAKEEETYGQYEVNKAAGN